MSRKRQMIELCPPEVFRETRAERLVLGGFTCPVCNGNGWNWVSDPEERDGWVKQDCPSCGGSGKIVAEVTVRWRKEESRDGKISDTGQER